MLTALETAVKCAQITAPFLAFLALVFTIRAGIQNKRADIMMECHRRFDQLSVLRHELTKRVNKTSDLTKDQELIDDINSWVQRFWSLQVDEYEFWRRGFIDNDFFRYWMISRHRDFSDAREDEIKNPARHTFKMLAFTQGFRVVVDTWADASHPRSDFKDFMEQVRKNRIDDAMSKYGPWFLRKWGLWG